MIIIGENLTQSAQRFFYCIENIFRFTKALSLIEDSCDFQFLLIIDIYFFE